MNRNRRNTIWSSLLLTMVASTWLSGCATKAPPVSTSSALSVSNIESANAAQLKENGLVYLYRSPSFVGSMVSFPVWDEAEKNKDLVVMRNGGYYLHFCSPGKHTFATRSEAKNSLSIDVEPGKVYFVKYSIHMGAFVGRPHIELVSQEQGAREAAECDKPLTKASNN